MDYQDIVLASTSTCDCYATSSLSLCSVRRCYNVSGL